MIYNDIIIIGDGNHHNTLGVIRSLGERKIEFDLISFGGKSKHYITSSKYVHNHIEFNNPQDTIPYLISNKRPDNKFIIISCADIITELLSEYYDELSDFCIIPGVNRKGVMKELQDKNKMIEMALIRNLESPKKWVIPDDIPNIIYPCITKGFFSAHGGKKDVAILNNIQELSDFIANNQENIFVQEYINKKEEVQFIGCSLDEGKEIIIPGMTKIIRSQNNTNTGFLEYGPINTFWEDTVLKSKKYIRDCRYSGLFSIEFIRDHNDKVYFLEINFRNDGNAYAVTASGVNLPAIWVKHCMGKDYRDEIKDVNQILVMPEFQDFKLVLEGKLSLKKWLRDVKITNCFLEWDRYDIKPFFKFIINKIF